MVEVNGSGMRGGKEVAEKVVVEETTLCVECGVRVMRVGVRTEDEMNCDKQDSEKE